MFETLLLASAMSGCIEREARSFQELVANDGQAIVECADRSYTEISVYQSFSMDAAGGGSVRYEFFVAGADAPTVYEIKPCRDFDFGEQGLGESLLTEVRCNGRTISLLLGPKALHLRANEEQLFSYPVETRFVIVNEMVYELAQADRPNR